MSAICELMGIDVYELSQLLVKGVGDGDHLIPDLAENFKGKGLITDIFNVLEAIKEQEKRLR